MDTSWMFEQTASTHRCKNGINDRTTYIFNHFPYIRQLFQVLTNFHVFSTCFIVLFTSVRLLFDRISVIMLNFMRSPTGLCWSKNISPRLSNVVIVFILWLDCKLHSIVVNTLNKSWTYHLIARPLNVSADMTDLFFIPVIATIHLERKVFILK